MYTRSRHNVSANSSLRTIRFFLLWNDAIFNVTDFRHVGNTKDNKLYTYFDHFSSNASIYELLCVYDSVVEICMNSLCFFFVYVGDQSNELFSFVISNSFTIRSIELRYVCFSSLLLFSWMCNLYCVLNTWRDTVTFFVFYFDFSAVLIRLTWWKFSNVYPL